MIAYARAHPWRIAAGALAAAATTAALLRGLHHDMYFSIALKPTLLLFYFAVCVAGFYLLDLLLFRKRPMAYIALLAGLLAVSSFIATWLAPITFVSAATTSTFIHAIGIGALLCISTFLRLLKERIQKKAEYNEYKARRAEAELQLLKRQLNPHFLFNTLNSLYAQCIADREGAAGMVLQLSDMLRYQLDADHHDRILLRDELSFLDHYVYFERRRLPADFDFRYTKSVAAAGVFVSPLLLITLVENCFKHGVAPGQRGAISILLEADANGLCLRTANTALLPASRGGTGLDNLRKRLTHLYPGRHTLTGAVADDGLYHASLRLQL